MVSSRVIGIFGYKCDNKITNNITDTMSTYKKAPPYRKDTHKHTGTSKPREIVFHGLGEASIREFDKACKAWALEQGATINTNK